MIPALHPVNERLQALTSSARRAFTEMRPHGPFLGRNQLWESCHPLRSSQVPFYPSVAPCSVGSRGDRFLRHFLRWWLITAARLVLCHPTTAIDATIIPTWFGGESCTGGVRYVLHCSRWSSHFQNRHCDLELDQVYSFLITEKIQLYRAGRDFPSVTKIL